METLLVLAVIGGVGYWLYKKGKLDGLFGPKDSE